MIFVKPAVLTEAEAAMGGAISDREFNSRYRPWLVPVHLRVGQPEGAGRGTREGAGEPEADSQNAAEQPAGAGQVEAQA